jgi:hypothetical protein
MTFDDTGVDDKESVVSTQLTLTANILLPIIINIGEYPTSPETSK